jgi:tRNA-splicing ligase RtcB
MPDAHLGKGVTIGTVFASEKYVCPNAVGVDIGCGMCAIPIHGLFKDDLSREQLESIQRKIKQRIPTGFDQHKKALPKTQEILARISEEHPPSKWLLNQLGTNVKPAEQLGTLGGGNHFLEVVFDESDHQVWVMLHSGSRNIGNITAAYHDQVAAQVMKSMGLPQPEERGLNYMPIESHEGAAYLQDMNWCQEYAFQNRQAMLELMLEIVCDEARHGYPDMEHAVNIHHNYCSCEQCTFTDPQSGRTVSKNLWITRKGATSAKNGEFGIIPGSMGVGSFITKGKANPLSWSSCSHGAGRRMSRTKAIKEIPQEDFVHFMKEMNVVCDTHPGVRDEAPQAYKDLTVVMKNQTDLVDVVHRLLPLVNVKGFEKKNR